MPLGDCGRGAPRLICFPHAGGGTSAYRSWADALSPDIDLFAVLPPGRESRFDEPLVTQFADLVAAAAAALHPLLDDGPCVLFGHSLGAAVAYEVARLLQHGAATPSALIVSGRQAPHLPSRRRPIAHLPDAEFIREVFALGGTPPEVASSQELVGLLLPMLRSDFTLAETYRPRPGAALTCPIIAVAGADDPCVDASGLQAWRDAGIGTFCSRLFPGDHFYLLDQRAPLLAYISQLMMQFSSTALA